MKDRLFMKKRSIVFMVVVPLILIGVYFGYKAFCLNFYKTNIESERMTILEPYVLSSQVLADDEYFKVRNISLKDEFEDFVKEESTVQSSEELFLESYQLKEGDTVKARISFYKNVSYVEGLKVSAEFLGSDKSEWLNKEVPKYMDSKDFKSDYEFLKFLSDYQEPEINIFTPVTVMKERFIVSSLIDIILPKYVMQEINGDYSGYILRRRDESEPNFTEANIENKGNKYTLYFLEKDKVLFTDSKIKELIDTIKID